MNPALDMDHDGILDSCQTGACCVAGGCSQLAPALCAAAGGTFSGLGTTCATPGVCGPPCPCDWDHSGSRDTADFFAFLNDFFAGNADFNHSGATDSQDFFDFVICFVQGC
jgi:hypothetical protein